MPLVVGRSQCWIVFMKQQPGFMSTQLHRGIGVS